MKSSIRRRLEMVARVRDFLRAHPVSDQSHAAIVARLEQNLTRATTLEVEEDQGRREARATNRHRKALRKETETQLVRYLERVGKIAARQAPALAGLFRGPPLNASNAAFLASGWDLLNLARSRQDILGRNGLAGSQLDELAATLTLYEEATERANGSRATHVGAAAALNGVTSELTELVGALDVLNRRRYAADLQQLAGWTSATEVAHPRKRTGKSAVPPQTPDLPRAA